MTDVTVDAASRTARVEGGALWIDVVEAVAQHGLAALHGSSPDVGIAGYSLGGGIGWYARKLGLATNSVTAVELVIADGTAAARRRGQRARAVLGAARRRRQLRRGHRAGVPALPDRHGVRRDPGLGPDGRRQVLRPWARGPPTPPTR